MIENLEKELEKATAYFFDQVKNIRTGNVSTALIDVIKVNYFGQNVPIKQLGQTVVSDGRILIRIYDRSCTKSIAKHLESLEFSAYVFSPTEVCVNIPRMSGEERTKIGKHINKLSEESLVSIRNIRRNFRKSLGEDYFKEIDNKVDSACKKVSEIAETIKDDLGAN